MDGLLPLRSSNSHETLMAALERTGKNPLLLMRHLRSDIPSPSYLGTMQHVHWCADSTKGYDSDAVWTRTLLDEIDKVVPVWRGRYDGILTHINMHANKPIVFIGAVKLHATMLKELTIESHLGRDEFIAVHPEKGEFLTRSVQHIVVDDRNYDAKTIGARLARRGVFGYARDGAVIHYLAALTRY